MSHPKDFLGENFVKIAIQYRMGEKEMALACNQKIAKQKLYSDDFMNRLIKEPCHPDTV